MSDIPEPETELRGKSIKGETLFGQEEIDLALWVSLIVEHAERTPRDPAGHSGLGGCSLATWDRGPLDRLAVGGWRFDHLLSATAGRRAG